MLGFRGTLDLECVVIGQEGSGDNTTLSALLWEFLLGDRAGNALLLLLLGDLRGVRDDMAALGPGRLLLFCIA